MVATGDPLSYRFTVLLFSAIPDIVGVVSFVYPPFETVPVTGGLLSEAVMLGTFGAEESMVTVRVAAVLSLPAWSVTVACIVYVPSLKVELVTDIVPALMSALVRVTVPTT